MSTIEQTGELARLEQEMREHVPDTFCDTLVSVLELNSQRVELALSNQMMSDTLARERIRGSGDFMGSIAEELIERGVGHRSDMVALSDVAHQMQEVIPGGSIKLDASSMEKARRTYVERILNACRKNKIDSIFPDPPSLMARMDESLSKVEKIIKDEQIQDPAALISGQENAKLLSFLIGVEALLALDKIPLDNIKTPPGVEPQDARQRVLMAMTEVLNPGMRDEKSIVEALFEEFDETVLDLFTHLTMLEKLDNSFISYRKRVVPMLAKYTDRLMKTMDVNEKAHAELTDAIAHILHHIPMVLREGVAVEEEPNFTSHRLLGALCVENWTEAAYRHIGIKVPREDAKPLHVFLEATEKEQCLAELAEALEPMLVGVDDIEARYVITSRFLRGRNGLGLRRDLEHYVEPGSNKTLFSHDQAHQLTGLSLLIEDETKAQQLKDDFRTLRQLWADIAFLSPDAKRSGLVRDLETLMEWHESASAKLLNDKGLAPVWKLAELLEPALTEDVSAPPVEDNLGEGNEPTPTVDPDQERETWRIPAEFAHVEFIEPFPPGDSRDIVSDLEGISREWKGDPVEWERIYSLMDLRKELESQGYGVMTHRLLQTNWHPLPHYVLEVMNPQTGRVTAVVESPIYGNASYIIPDEDWREIVRFSKEDVRQEWGGMAKVHAPNRSHAEHREKLKNAVVAHT